MVLGATLFLITFIDVRNNRISNKMVLLILIEQGIITSISFKQASVIDNVIQLSERLMITFLITSFLFFFFSIGALGAGDLKLLAVLAVGFNNPAIYSLVTLLCAFILSLIRMIRRHMLISRIKYLINYLAKIFYGQKLENYIPRSLSASEKIAYSIHLSVPMFIAWVIYEGYLLIN